MTGVTRDAGAVGTGSAAPTAARIRVVRWVLVVVGVLVLAFGAMTLFSVQRPHQVVGLVTWLVAAVILHDAVLSPFVVLVGMLLRRAGRSLRPWAVVVVQIAVAVAAVLALVVLPEIAAKHHGVKNPTVLPFDYTLRLAVTEVVLGVVAVAAVIAGLAGQRHRRARR